MTSNEKMFKVSCLVFIFIKLFDIFKLAYLWPIFISGYFSLKQWKISVCVFSRMYFSCSMYSPGPILERFTSLLLPVGLDIPGLDQKSCALARCSSGILSFLVFLSRIVHGVDKSKAFLLCRMLFTILLLLTPRADAKSLFVFEHAPL